MRLNLIIPIIGLFLASAVFIQDLSGQDFYSYTDENGVRIFTNIPPINSKAPVYGSGMQNTLSRGASSSRQGTDQNSQAYDSLINKYAGHYQLDPALIHAIIATESGFNPKAVSSKGARGLMQLMPDTAERLGVNDSFDPEQNIRGGVRHFRTLMDTFNNDLDLSLAAYNAGENLVQRLGNIPPYKETMDYVRSVNRRYKERLAKVQGTDIEGNTPTFRYVDASGTLVLTNIPPGR